jgi:hypothetical protein
MSGTVRLRFVNACHSLRDLVIEPWGGRYPLEPGGSYEVVASGDLGMPLELEIHEDRIVLSAFDSEGADIHVYQAGKEVRAR